MVQKTKDASISRDLNTNFRSFPKVSDEWIEQHYNSNRCQRA